MPIKELLYSAGGGIISDLQRAGQNGSVSIVIGLGGTGKNALKRLKNEVYRRIMPDNPGDELPQYSRIRYLCIDTDADDLRNESDLVGLNRDTELFDISIDAGILTNPVIRARLKDKPYAKWLNDIKIAPRVNMEACGDRQFGRYALGSHSARLRNRLLSLFGSAAKENPLTPTFVNDVNIHILAGLGGSVGGGTFLDVCYLVRDAVSSCTALARKNVIISGYVFMPDIWLDRVPSLCIRYIEQNSFDALKELDRCMGFADGGGEWNEQYEGFSIRTARPPVDVCYLISASDVKGNTSRDGYDRAIGVASEHIVWSISDTAINMSSQINYYMRADRILRKPCAGNYKYVAIGASNSPIPLQETATYLASLLFGRMAAAWDRLPTEEECAEFADRLGLNVDVLLRQLGPASVPLLNIDCQWNTLPTDDNGDRYSYGYVLPETLLGPFNREEAMVRGKLRAGREAMCGPWSPDSVPDDISSASPSIVCRVYKALYDAVADPERGPLYAAALLYGSTRLNLICILLGLKKEASERCDDAVGKIDLSAGAVRQACQAFNMARTGFLHRKEKPRAFQNLLQRIKMDMDNRCQAARLAELVTGLDTAMKQLRELNSKFFERYQSVILSLRDTFADNVAAIGELEDNTGDPLTLPLFRISGMRDTLNEAVNGLDLTAVIDQFNNAFFAGALDVWYRGDDYRIARWMSSYMTDAFREYLNKSMDDYVRTLYPQYEADATPSRLTEAIKTDIIAKLDETAAPMFRANTAWEPYMIDLFSTWGCCAAPQTAPIINQAIEDYRQQKAVKGLPCTHVTGPNDRILFLKHTITIPLIAYKWREQVWPSDPEEDGDLFMRQQTKS